MIARLILVICLLLFASSAFGTPITFSAIGQTSEEISFVGDTNNHNYFDTYKNYFATQSFTLNDGESWVFSPYSGDGKPSGGLYSTRTVVDMNFMLPEPVKLHFELGLTTEPGYLYPQSHLFTVTYDCAESIVPTYFTKGPDASLTLNLKDGNILKFSYKYNGIPDDQTILDTVVITHMGQHCPEPGTWSLLGLGLASLFAVHRRKR